MISLLAGVLILTAAAPLPADDELATNWRVVLESPGGELPFCLDLFSRDDGLHGLIHNGEERVRVGEVRRDGRDLVLRLDPYDSFLHLRLGEDGRSMNGRWQKSLGGNRHAELPAFATATKDPRFPLTPLDAEQRARLDGRWAVRFSTEEAGAVGHFRSFEDGRAEGTFETTLGDYRFLAGAFDGERLRLSCFDGGHAFLFDARLDADGRLEGGFWSRDSWYETWSATKDPEASLPDSFELTRWTGEVGLGELAFPDTSGELRRLDEAAFAGEARIITLFGTWCPNCNDEARFLVDLERRYKRRGLRVQGLAFELDEDADRSRAQVERFRERHGVHYPILLAGTANKEAASRAFPALDRVRAFPTTLVLDREGQVRAVHTGFSGPATGAAHEHLRERYELLIEELMREGE